MIVLNEPGRYVARIFYSELDVLGPNAGNLLALIYRDKGEDFWRMSMRFRYYVDDLKFNSKDRKSVYDSRGPSGQGLDQVLPTLRHIFEIAGGGGFEEVIVESDDPAVIWQRFQEQPWAHIGEMPEGN